MRCGRDPAEVQLIPVTKTLSTEVIRVAYNCGLRKFAESKAQEFRAKINLLPPDIEWHFIGHLQTNKIKYVLPPCNLIHSVDTLKLAQAISDFCARKSMTCSILMEVKTSVEESKYGVDTFQALDLFWQIKKLARIHLCGLMTIAPFTEDRHLIRRSFVTLREIREKIYNTIGRDQKLELSMGMSQDFEIAIEEGSTMVRIGTSIFGPRGR